MLNKSSILAVLSLGLGAMLPVSNAAASPVLLKKTCGNCHSVTEGKLSRISKQRKTPEAWHMTIFRMRSLHGLEIDTDTQRKLIQYLSDEQGLAPSETSGLRYSFDRSPAAQETLEGPVVDMCGRCHTAARVALQRRTEEEWRLHVDFHVGQYPTVEYQAGGRDRHWYKIARDEVVPVLAKDYPLQTEAWTQWQQADKPVASGEWTISTSIPGVGPAFGSMTVTAKDSKGYRLSGSLQGADGVVRALSGSVNIYTGFEWRATIKVGDTAYRQVLALSEDGNSLEGRHFIKADDSMGASFSALKNGGGAKLMAVVPENIAAGSTATVMLVGRGLKDTFTAGPGLEIISQELTSTGVSLNVKASAETNAMSSFESGDVEANIAIFSGIDRLSVEPNYAVARVGGDGGSEESAKAMFDAVGWLNGADGKPETEDDIRVGHLTSTWELAPFDEVANELDDVSFVGKLDANTGVFLPAVAGPNSKRPFSTNNAGNMKVIANYGDIKAEAQMIVTVQRWNDPPLR